MSKQQFRLYFDPDPNRLPPHTTRRPATPEERRFLRRYNLIRLLRIFTFWLAILIIVTLSAVLFWYGLDLIRDTPPALEGSIWILTLFVIVPALLLGIVLLRQKGKHLLHALAVRPLLTVPDDLEIVQFRADWGVLIHETANEANIFLAGQMTVELPGHWENQVAARMNASQKVLRPQIALARLPGAHNRIIRLPMHSDHYYRPRRIDMLLRDIGNIVVGWDDLSIDREMRARLPVISGHPELATQIVQSFGFGLMFYLFYVVAANISNSDMQRIEDRLSNLARQHLSGSKVDIEGLAQRGFTGLTAVPGYGGRIVTADPFDIVPAGHERNQNALYLRPEELAPISRLARVFPDRFPGSGAPDAGIIAEYRTQLEVPAGTPSARAKLQAMPDGLIAKQMMAQADASRVAPDFIEALLPSPSIEAEDHQGYGRPPPVYPCKQIGPICASSDPPQRWQNPAFKTIDGRIRLFDPADLDRFAPLEDEFSQVKSRPWARYLWRAAMVAFGICGLIWARRLLAARRLKRYYRSN